jgi:hypothetical protein
MPRPAVDGDVEAEEEVAVEANKVRDAGGNRLTDIEVTFPITFPGGEQRRCRPGNPA